MNIQEIKAKLNVTSIDFTRGSKPDPAAPLDKTKNIPTVWLRSWDNEKRISILAHQDVIAAVKGGSDKLAVKTAVKRSMKPGETKDNASGEPYTEYTIITAASIEVTV